MFFIFSNFNSLIQNSSLDWKTVTKPSIELPDQVVGLISHHDLLDSSLDLNSITSNLFLIKQIGDQLFISDFKQLVEIELKEFELKFNSHKGEWLKVAQKLTRQTTNKLFITPTKKLVLVPIFTQRGSVHILAQTESGKFLIVKQYRPGPEKVLSDIPGGGMEEGENPEEAGLRELLEETGYTGEVTYLHTCFNAAYSSMLKHTIVVTGCKKVDELQNDDEENLGVSEVTKEELLGIVNKGDITLSDFATIMYGLTMLK